MFGYEQSSNLKEKKGSSLLTKVSSNKEYSVVQAKQFSPLQFSGINGNKKANSIQSVYRKAIQCFKPNPTVYRVARSWEPVFKVRERDVVRSMTKGNIIEGHGVSVDTRHEYLAQNFTGKVYEVENIPDGKRIGVYPNVGTGHKEIAPTEEMKKRDYIDAVNSITVSEKCEAKPEHPQTVAI